MKNFSWMQTIAVCLLFSWMLTPLEAQTGATDANTSWVDNWYETVSGEVVDWSEAIDRRLYQWLGGDENISERGTETPLEAERQQTDTFFQTQKYLSETSISYVRLRLGTALRSLDSDETNFNVRVHLPLSRTRKRLRLFIEDLNEDNVENLVKKTENGSEEVSPKVGINYFAPKTYGIYSKYSLGLSGLHPYLRARYNMVFEPGGWVVEPVQIFQYSEKYDFSEKTDLYFDTEPWEETLFRVQLNRGTRAHKKGMAYGIGLSYHWGLTGHSGMRLIQSFSGHTHYEYTPDDTDETKEYSGIYSYTTAFGYRRSVWKKWLYMEAIPAINFHKMHHFHPNYSFTIFFDLFFGNYR
ncbi:hypothetical protein [Hydrogenimonas urashimensis]|uniref:hypothetical protein n=1 Tax=Hydrogenimonas urashimensis TaxID=2740515 RepID=UPI001914EF2C|nr:hypothetical protein [Hydrogenimonas urashimensis]